MNARSCFRAALITHTRAIACAGSKFRVTVAYVTVQTSKRARTVERRGHMLRPTNSAASVVASWLGSAKAASSSDNVAMPEFKPRPERLGLGAKYVPHKAALSPLSAAEQKLSKKLKGKPAQQPERAAAARAHESDDDSADEGRSSSIRSNKRKPSATTVSLGQPAQHVSQKKKKRS